MTALIVFAHGSRVEAANEAVRSFVGSLRQEMPDTEIEAAFLELGKPELPEAVRSLWGRGIRNMTVVPYFLTPGIHLQRDLPRLVESLQRELPGLQIAVTPSLDGHPALQQAVLERARAVTIRSEPA